MGFFSKLFGKKNVDISTVVKTHNDDSPAIICNPVITVKVERKEVPYDNTPDIPEFQGDYAKAVFLNAYSKSSPIKSKHEYQGYLLYECGIRDSVKYHKLLIDEGYLEKSTSADMVSALKVTELKSWLSELGLPVGGKKDALVERIVCAVGEEEIQRKLPNQTYVISEKGRNFLEEHEAYIKIHTHKNWGITWQEYESKKHPGYRIYDVFWGIFNERVVKNGWHCRNDYLCMYQLLVEEGKRQNAVEMLLRVIYLDVSGVEGLTYLDMYRIGAFSLKDTKETFGAAILLAPGLIKDLASFSDVYNDGLVDRLYEWKLPLQICTKRQFLNFVHSVFDGTYVEEIFEEKLKSGYYKAIREIKEQQ